MAEPHLPRAGGSFDRQPARVFIRLLYDFIAEATRPELNRHVSHANYSLTRLSYFRQCANSLLLAYQLPERLSGPFGAHQGFADEKGAVAVLLETPQVVG